MSVGRDVIASVCNCAEEDVKCENCFRFDGGRLFNCVFWDQHTKLDSFCSFFSSRFLMRYAAQVQLREQYQEETVFA